MPLFFGRLDYDAGLGAEQDETLYIGRRHVTGEAGGEPMVIDWRAGMSLPFYRARPGEPMGVRRRRRFGFAHGRLTAYEDEDLTARCSRWPPPTSSSRRSSGHGPGRCATSSPPSSRSRTPSSGPDWPSRSACRARRAPGRPRSGCTAPRTCCTPSATSSPAPACWWSARTTASCPTSATCCPRSARSTPPRPRSRPWSPRPPASPIRGVDPVPAALIKGDARMAEVLQRAVWSHLGRADGPLVVPRGAHQWRVGGYLADEIISELRARGVRYEAGRAMLPQRLAAPGAAADGGRTATPPTTGCRTRSPAASRSRRTPTPSGRRWTREADPPAADRRRVPGAGRPRAILSADEQQADHAEPAGPLGRPRPAGRWPTRS